MEIPPGEIPPGEIPPSDPDKKPIMSFDIETLGPGIAGRYQTHKEWKPGFDDILEKLREMYITSIALVKQETPDNKTTFLWQFGEHTEWVNVDDEENEFRIFVLKHGSESFKKALPFFFQDGQKENGKPCSLIREPTPDFYQKWVECWLTIQEHCKTGVLIGYNSSFDLRLLRDTMPYGEWVSDLSDGKLSIESRIKWVDGIEKRVIDTFKALDRQYELYGVATNKFERCERTLESTCKRNGISLGKEGDGLQAIAWAINGEWNKLADYNVKDAELHLDLFIKIFREQKGFYLPKRMVPDQTLWPIIPWKESRHVQPILLATTVKGPTNKKRKATDDS